VTGQVLAHRHRQRHARPAAYNTVHSCCHAQADRASCAEIELLKVFQAGSSSLSSFG